MPNELLDIPAEDVTSRPHVKVRVREAMREQMQTRLEGLKKELATGRGALEKVEQQRTYLHETILRIAGAIQVLEELLAEVQPARRDDTGPDVTQTTFAKDHAIDGQ